MQRKCSKLFCHGKNYFHGKHYLQGKHCFQEKQYFFCMALIVAIALFATGCNGSTKEPPSGAVQDSETVWPDNSQIGEGSTEFTLVVVDKDGNETHLEIHTDKEMLGEALTELGLIAGEESEYGLYVKTVNGITADYDADGVYWAFYMDGEYSMTGVDATPVNAGASYCFKVE